MNNFLAHSDDVREQMLNSIGVSSIEDLFSKIPNEARVSDLKLSDVLSEMQVQREVKSIARKNNTDAISFLGAGVYNHFIPACVSQVAGRYEFLTAYTPYQPEISQGTLQVMYEFQSLICNLTGMDVSNASVYDGATACAEAILMASRITKKRKAIVSDTINPEYKEVIKTYTHANEIEVDFIDAVDYKTDFVAINEKVKSGEYACVLIQSPNYYGSIEELENTYSEFKTLLVACVNLSSLSVLKEPSVADIVVGDIQPLGIPMSFGGPHAGVMACREKYLRQMPGRIAGKTLDADGNDAYTLTIQTREQHIKREKATSNICSNQALVALCSTLYLSLIGEKGFKQVGILSSANAHKLSEGLAKKGIKTLNTDFYNEFVIEVNNADNFLAKLKAKNIIGGRKIDDAKVLVAATEMNLEEDINLYLENC